MVGLTIAGGELARIDPLTGVRGRAAIPFLSPDPGVPLRMATNAPKLTPEKAWKSQPSLRKVVRSTS